MCRGFATDHAGKLVGREYRHAPLAADPSHDLNLGGVANALPDAGGDRTRPRCDGTVQDRSLRGGAGGALPLLVRCRHTCVPVVKAMLRRLIRNPRSSQMVVGPGVSSSSESGDTAGVRGCVRALVRRGYDRSRRACRPQLRPITAALRPGRRRSCSRRSWSHRAWRTPSSPPFAARRRAIRRLQ
jgi:hypothetical protein